MGKYIDSVPHTIRSQGLDCPVGAAAAQCPGTVAQGPGGYTYVDLNGSDNLELAKGGEISLDWDAPKLEHLEEAIAAANLSLSAEEIERLEEPYVPHPVLGHE